MGYVFTLILWLIVFCIIAVILSIIGLVCSLIIFWKSDKKKRKILLSTLLPGITVLFLFFIYNFEWLVYSVVTNTDPGLGDYSCVNINSRYTLSDNDGTGWYLYDKEEEKEIINNVNEILEHDDKILLSSRVWSMQPDTTYYILYQVDALVPEYAAIDTARTEQEVWSRYVAEHNIDSSEIYTCYNYYCKSPKGMSREYAVYLFFIFDILLCVFLIRLVWRKVCMPSDTKNNTCCPGKDFTP